MFAEGFSQQKRNIFTFGPNATDDTKPVLKISQGSPETMVKLDKFTDVHNIGVERIAGSFSY